MDFTSKRVSVAFLAGVQDALAADLRSTGLNTEVGIYTLESVDLIYLLDGAFGGEIMRECLTYSADGLRLGVLIVYQTESALDQLIAWMSQVQDAVQEYVKNIWPYCPNTQSRRHALLAAIHDGAPVWGCDEHQIYIPLGDLDNSR